MRSGREPAFLSRFGIVCAAGRGAEALAEAVQRGSSPGLLHDPGLGPESVYLVGRVDGPLEAPPGVPTGMDSRNNRLAWAAVGPLRPELEALVGRHGPSRVAVVAGTSTSGMLEAERAFGVGDGVPRLTGFRYDLQEMGSPSSFLAWALGLGGPALTVSTACSSSAKALAVGRRLLRLGVCDAVLCGGVDSLCRFTVAGFAALGAASRRRCAPFCEGRDGINVAEAAAFCLLTRAEAPVRLAGCGESSDAHSPSAPLPGGEGAEEAMRAALEDGGADPAGVGYLNLHGTGTPLNDAMEARAVARVFPGGIPCSSTKPLTGHTLGAAGALEAALCWELLAGCLRERGLPRQWTDLPLDPALPRLDFVQGPVPASSLRRALSNSFGFGGSNVSLLLERA